MSNFTFKNKEKMQLESDQSENFSEKQLSTITQLDEQFDENAYVYQEELAQMTPEEKVSAKAAMEKGYYKQLRQGKSDAALSDRQKNKLQSQARDMVKSSGERVAKFRKKVDELANKIASSNKIDKSSITLEALENYEIPKNASKDTKKQIKILRKAAPKIFGRLREYEDLYENLQSDEKQDKGLIKFVASELENARAEWRLMQKRINESVPTEVKHTSYKDANERVASHGALDDTFVTIDLDKFDDERVVRKDYKHKPVNKQLIEAEIKKSLEKKEINWDRDIQAEIKEAEATLEKLKEDADVKTIRDQKRLVNDLKIEEYTKSKMQEIIEESDDPNLTFKDIERTVTNYLKEVTKNCEVKFRAKPLGVKHILNGCSMSGEADEYEDLFHKMYSPNANVSTRGNLTFGYLGGKDVSGFIGKTKLGEGLLYRYGNVAIKLNKEKVRNRCGFLAGNSRYNYSKQRGRSIDNPDILSAGSLLGKLYERAKDIEQGGKMMSVEQEATLLDKDYPYFECQIVGSITASDVEELQFSMDYLPRNVEELKKELREGDKSQALWDLFKQVNTINKEATIYNREGMKPLKLSVWGGNGVEVTYDELKMIFQSREGEE